MPLPPARQARPLAGGRGQRGLVMVEILLAMLIIAVATLSSASMTLSGSNLNKANVLTADATNVLRQVVEELESHPFEEIYARFNTNPADDPDGAGTARGGQFTLDPEHRTAFLDAGAAPTATSREGASRGISYDIDILFPEDENGNLAEGVSAPIWGSQAWDINGDGAPSSGDRSADYKLLPVGISVTWADPEGLHTFQVVRLLSQRRP